MFEKFVHEGVLLYMSYGITNITFGYFVAVAMTCPGLSLVTMLTEVMAPVVMANGVHDPFSIGTRH